MPIPAGMTAPTSLAVRMKGYEHTFRTYLPRRAWTLIRVDGKAFHSYTRGLERPFDTQFAADMDATAVALCTQMTGAAFAYVQSDEISVLLTDFAAMNTEPWMGGTTAKVVSLSAAIATATFNTRRPTTNPDDNASGGLPLFDSRAWSMSDPAEVANYFLWRQRDAVKNSISMAASAHFSHQRLHGLTANQRQELLHTDAGVNWNNYPTGFKRGRVVSRVAVEDEVTYTHGKTGETITQPVTRNTWAITDAPHFTHDPDGWLRTHIPVIPEMRPA